MMKAYGWDLKMIIIPSKMILVSYDKSRLKIFKLLHRNWQKIDGISFCLFCYNFTSQVMLLENPDFKTCKESGHFMLEVPKNESS